MNPHSLIRSVPQVRSVAVWLLATLLIFSLGSLLALMGPGKPAVLLLGAIGSLFLFALDEEQMLLLMAATVYLVVGQLMYFAHMNQGLWIPYGLCALLFLRILPAYLNSPLTRARLGLPLGKAVGFFVLTVLLSVGVNQPPFLQAIVGGKAFLMEWAVFLLLALYSVPFRRLEQGFRCLFLLVYLQVPFVLYQYFVVAPTRSNRGGRFGASWDAIVGSFGGDPNSGGASGTMAYVLTLAAVLAISLWRHKQKSFWSTAALLLTALVCIGLAEVKVVVVLLPVAMAVLYRSELLRKPVRTALVGLATLSLALGILLVYNQTHAVASQRAHDLEGLYQQSFGYSLDSKFINYETGEMGRMAALKFWVSEGFERDTLRGVVGYGPGAARSSSSLAVGEVARRYSFGIDRSVAATLLWELGLLGFISFCTVLVLGVWMALRAATRATTAQSRATLEACGAGLAMCLVMLPYGRDVLEFPALTFTMMCMLGYAAQAHGMQLLAERRERAGSRSAEFDAVTSV